jgi:hypothetical protein
MNSSWQWWHQYKYLLLHFTWQHSYMVDKVPSTWTFGDMFNHSTDSISILMSIQIFFFFLSHWGLNSRCTFWATLPVLFVVGLKIESHKLFSWGAWNHDLLISAFWVARIIGVSHQHMACSDFLIICDSALVNCVFLGIYSFPLDYPTFQTFEYT